MRFLAVFLLPFWLFAQTIEIDINYGGVKEARTVKAEYKSGESALAVLSKVAKVKTKKVGEFVFITSIDGVASAPQKMGWFYTVDGKSADKTASTNILKDAKSMRWEYHTDNCLSGAAK
ncbi:MAG: DUF4430 domain-containing protein [Campylobacterales bacterium]